MRVLALAIDFADSMYDPLPRVQRALARAVAAFQGDSAVLATALGEELAEKETVDLLDVDGERSHAAVCADVQRRSPFLGPSSVVAFDDCDPRFPGVEEAVNAIAAERKALLRVLGFRPSAHAVVAMGCPVALASLGGEAGTTESGPA